MTQEKELLLKDLCARLPYHPFFIGKKHDMMPLYNVNTYVGIIDCIPAEKIEDCRLYLRPMSSMTEEERLYFHRNSARVQILVDEEKVITKPFYGYTTHLFDWLNAHHFDYRCLIEKGLALKAKEGMYNDI